MIINAVTEPFLGSIYTLSGGMRGAGYTKMPMVINFFGLIVLRLSFGYLFAFGLGLGLVGVWFAIAIEIVVRSILTYFVFLKGKWMKVEV